jgi:hypothetical protein
MPLHSENVSFELRSHPWFNGSGNALSATLLTADNSSYHWECPTSESSGKRLLCATNSYLVLICIRDGSSLPLSYYSKSSLTLKIVKPWLQTLKNFDKDKISTAVLNPIEFVLPHGVILATEIAKRLQRLTSTYERARDKIPGESGIPEERNYPVMMRHAQVLLKDIRFALRSLSKLQDCPHQKPLATDF